MDKRCFMLAILYSDGSKKQVPHGIASRLCY